MKDIALHILDIAQNSVRAGATQVLIKISEDQKQNKFDLVVEDNGSGIDEKILDQVTDPFHTSRTTRKVGMGLPLLRHSAEQAGGHLSIRSQTGKGTLVIATFIWDHIDRPPGGDLAGVIVQMIFAYPEINFVYTHSTIDGSFEISTKEIIESLGKISGIDAKLKSELKAMIIANLKDISADC